MIKKQKKMKYGNLKNLYKNLHI